jgi:hypothetical protein
MNYMDTVPVACLKTRRICRVLERGGIYDLRFTIYEAGVERGRGATRGGGVAWEMEEERVHLAHAELFDQVSREIVGSGLA